MLTVTTNEAKKINDFFAHDRKTAERYLLNFLQIEKAYEEQKEAYINYKENDSNVGGGSSGIGDPTGQKAMKGIRFDAEHEEPRWLKAVRICRAGLGERKNIFIECRIEAEKNSFRNGDRGRKAWVIYTQRRYAEEIEKRFLSMEHVSDKTMRLWWQMIIDRVIYIANLFK